jgi:hypothetical protein
MKLLQHLARAGGCGTYLNSHPAQAPQKRKGAS